MDTTHHGNIQNKGRTSSTNSLTRTCHSAIALLLFSPAFIFLSCSGDFGPASSGEKCTSVISVRTHHRAMTESAGSDIDVFIFNDDRLKRIDSYQRLRAGADNTVAAASRKGRKIAVAIMNPQKDEYEWNSISSFETLSEMCADLRLENPESPLMSGVAHIDADENGYFEIDMKPVLSEIFIRSIRCDFSGRPYSSATLENGCIYLANINTLAKIVSDGDFTPVAPLNTDGLPYDSYRSMENPEMVYAEFGQDVGSTALAPGIRLWCYPNSSEKDTAGTPFTRLVIAGDINGNRYYYPLNINKGEFGPAEGVSGIGRNCRYVFDIVIRQTGSLDPAVPVSSETVNICTGIEPWEEIESDMKF